MKKKKINYGLALLALLRGGKMTDKPKKTYLLRNIPAPLWTAAKLKAVEECVSVRVLILKAIEKTVNDKEDSHAIAELKIECDKLAEKTDEAIT